MGLFSSKKKTYVSSSLYNLSGDPTGKPSFKRTAVAGAIVRGYNIPLDLRNTYLTGYAMTTRSFARWAESSGYNSAIGMAKSRIALQSSFSTEPVREYLQTLASPGETIEVITAEGGPADHGMWADRYMIEHYLPANANGLQDGVEYDYSVDSVTGSLRVSIGPTPAKGEADTRPQYIVPVMDFDVNGHYVYAVYRGNTSGDATRNVLGDWRTIDNIVASEPDLTGWVQATGSQNVSTNVKLLTTVTTVTKLANGTVSTSTPVVTSRNESVAVTKDTWTREVYVGGSKTDTLDLEKELQTIERDYSYIITEESTVTVTTFTGSAFMGTNGVRTTTTVRQVLVPVKRYRQSVNTVTTQRYGPAKVLIYKVGSGVPELDSLVQQSVAHIDWLPFIPVRIDNKFLEERDEGLFAFTNKAFKKMFGRRVKLQSVVDSLKENDSLDEIDFAHIAFGVPLNTKSQWGLQYIYKFLEGLSAASGQSKATFDNYSRAYKAYEAYTKESQEWYESQNTEWGSTKSRPIEVSMPVRPKGAITFKSARSDLHFHQVLEYEFIYEERGTGRLMVNNKPAPVGHFWWAGLREVDEDVAQKDTRNKSGTSRSFLTGLRRRSATIVLNWQDTPRTWKRMVLRGALHTNYAYKDYSVKTYPSDAMSDEDESGFFFPLNAAIFKSMGIVDSTEMYNCTAYLILNSYKVVKKKWYQTGFFAVLLVIVAIVVSFYYPPAGGAAGGVLGTNAAVGAAITGLAATSTIALLVGAVANAIAGMILGAIISRVATKVLGNSVLGQIVATVAVIMIGNYQTAATNGSSTLSFAESFGSLMKAENLLRLGMSATNGLTDYVNKSTMHIMEEAKQLQEAYSAEVRRIHEMYVEQFGAGKVIDPMAFTSAGKGKVESLDTFLTRTLMTGMDIAETTHSMLSEFASLTLTLDTKV